MSVDASIRRALSARLVTDRKGAIGSMTTEVPRADFERFDRLAAAAGLTKSALLRRLVLAHLRAADAGVNAEAGEPIGGMRLRFEALTEARENVLVGVVLLGAIERLGGRVTWWLDLPMLRERPRQAATFAAARAAVAEALAQWREAAAQ